MKLITLKPPETRRETFVYIRENVFPRKVYYANVLTTTANKLHQFLHNIIIESSFNAGEYQINFPGFKLIRYA